MMIYTARQLEELFKASGQVVLPYRARLTPMATDWVRARRITVGYSDADVVAVTAQVKAANEALAAASSGTSSPFLWWCDGPCGTAKAALMAQAREATLGELAVPSDGGKLVLAIKALAEEVKSGRAAGGLLMVQAGASALVYANRCPSLRAIVGTCLETVEQGIRHVAANVLVIEHPHKTLQQIRNMLSRFVKAKRDVTDEIKRSLGELSKCG